MHAAVQTRLVGLPVLLGVLLLGTGCVPLTRARLEPETSLRQAQGLALRTSPEAWTIELTLPNPGGAVPWEVVPEGLPPVKRRAEGERAIFAWEVSAARWRDKHPFLVQVRTAGLDETVSLPHPTLEQDLAKPLRIVLEILRPIPHF
ncbi:MAG TPA: hypothetical protein VGK03_10070 [Geothrix sp.]|jgi:hypothetical protein